MGQHHIHTAAQVPIAAGTGPALVQPLLRSSGSALLMEVLKEATKKNYEKALALSTKQSGQDQDIVNARGVCLMRIGKYEQAVAVFRNLVLLGGCPCMRKDRPPHFKTNFATSLLLNGHPRGCLAVLHELGAEAPPVADTLRYAIKRWESTLPFWTWLDWKIYGASPYNRPVPIDFEPGDFGIEAILPDAGSGGIQTTPPRNAA